MAVIFRAILSESERSFGVYLGPSVYKSTDVTDANPPA
jgi:hypothetical protein